VHGFIANPRRSIAPGRKFSINTSIRSINFRQSPIPSGCFKSIEMPRCRGSAEKKCASPPENGGPQRAHVARARFEFVDLRAVVAEKQSAIRTGKRVREVEYANAVQRARLRVANGIG